MKQIELRCGQIIIPFYFDDNQQESVEKLTKGLNEIINDKQLSLEEFSKKVNSLLNSRKKVNFFDDALLTVKGNALMEKEDYEKANILLELSLDRATQGSYSEEIVLFLRLAQYQFIIGNEEKGTEYLIRLCEGEVSNYVEVINAYGLLDIWNQYSKYVEGKVRASAITEMADTKEPTECSKLIGEIRGIKEKHELLTELSLHINEICADGEYLNYLNKWERTFFYIDQLWERVNSDGFESYLTYDGKNFKKAKKASEDLEIVELTRILEKVEKKFPRSKVPRNTDKIEDIIDEKELEFDELDDEFYDGYDAIIADALYKYFETYSEKFR
ncbi:MAG: DMP19 family protein [Eubacterium sp.]|nr:DMP19 family protein [Eubacterium sp.]